MARNPILIVLSLRGGCDGLNLVGPSADPIYITERKADTRVEREGDNKGLPLTNKTRSHFEAMDYMERGTPDNKNTPSGWLARLVAQQHIHGVVPVVSTSDSLPASLLACRDAVAIPNVGHIQVRTSPRFHETDSWFLNHNYTGGDPVRECGLRSLGVVDALAAHALTKGKPADYTPTAGVTYPGGNASGLSNSLKTLAQLIKMDVGVQVATVDYGGWDTHVNQAGRFANLVDGLSGALSAFWNDMAAYQSDLTIVTLSEFGRRLKSNDSGGTDHGHGNAMLVLGGGINGGNIYGKWPGLDNAHLSNGVDLAVTTDYRQVLSELVMHQVPTASIDPIFPKFSAQKSPIGIV